MIDVAVLAGIVVARYLVPFLEKGAEQLFEAVSGKLGDTAAEHAVSVTEQIWARVRSVFRSDDDKGTLANFERLPRAGQPMVEAILRDKLQQDGKLAEELEQLVEKQSPDGHGSGAKIIGETVGFVDARGADISGGVVAGLIQGYDVAPGTPSPKSPQASPPSD